MGTCRNPSDRDGLGNGAELSAAGWMAGINYRAPLSNTSYVGARCGLLRWTLDAKFWHANNFGPPTVYTGSVNGFGGYRGGGIGVNLGRQFDPGLNLDWHKLNKNGFSVDTTTFTVNLEYRF